jgi:CheY-like chemotaxis protein
MSTTSSKYVLMLENDSDDRYITQATVKELNVDIPIRYEYWSASILKDVENDKPGVILLAYNTSPENGLEIVKKIKSDKNYAATPVIVLIEQLLEDLIKKYYIAGANTVIRKPSSVEQTSKKIKTFFDYWFTVAEL